MSRIFDIAMLSEMSFREKSAWISFTTILVIFSFYFWSVASVIEGDAEYESAIRLQIGLLAAFVVLEVILHVVIVLQAPKEARAPRDEREQLIEMKATRVAFQVLVLGALACVWLMHYTRSAWAIGQHVLLAIVVAELVKFGGQILYYRRGV